MENVIIQLLICLIGLFGLFYGGEKLVTGSVNTASFFKVKPQFVAITIIALGTSFPELVVSVNAVVDESPGIAWGNVLGSNISNILLVLGLASLMHPLYLKGGKSNANIFWLFFSSVLFFSISVGTKSISFFYGIVLILLLIIFLIYMVYISRNNGNTPDRNKIEEKLSLLNTILFIFFGIIILIISAEAVVNSSVKIASIFNVPETFIGLTIIAIGTSLPEISASIVAVKKGYSEIAVGNVIGSNIFNTLGIIGTCAVFSRGSEFLVPESFLIFDVPFMLISTLLFCLLIYINVVLGKKIGVIFITTYFVYIFLNFKLA